MTARSSRASWDSPAGRFDLVNASNQTVVAKTDSNGAFSFTGVGPGTYTIKVVEQSGYVASSQAVLTVSAQSGIDVNNLDFGEFVPVTLAGEVYGDTDGDGTLDGSESGLSGWTVNLVNSSNQAVASTKTNSTGGYSFGGVGGGTYAIQVVQPTGYVVSSAPLRVTTSSGQDISGLDVGEFQTVALTGEVYSDANGDGQLDGNESGLSGWTVNLQDSSNNVVATSKTGSDGSFSFAGVGPGSYSIAEVLEAGYFQTSLPATYSETTSSGQDVAGLVFGVARGASITGELFEDSNQDGSLDGGESGLAGWTIDLLNGGQVAATTVTDVGGDYSFAGLAPGSYAIQEVLQPGYIPTSPASGSVSLTVTSGAQAKGEDLGVFKAVALAVGGLTTAPSTGLLSGTSLVVRWSDTNTGTQAAVGSFNDSVTITNTTTGAVLAAATVTYDASTSGNLAAGASAPMMYQFRLPDGAAGVGQIEFAVTADVNDDVSTGQGEPARSATITEGSTLAPYPDLQVTNLAITPASGLQSGGHLTLSWDDSNTGDGHRGDLVVRLDHRDEYDDRPVPGHVDLGLRRDGRRQRPARRRCLRVPAVRSDPARRRGGRRQDPVLRHDRRLQPGLRVQCVRPRWIEHGGIQQHLQRVSILDPGALSRPHGLRPGCHPSIRPPVRETVLTIGWDDVNAGTAPSTARSSITS